MEQRARGTLQLWAEPFTALRVPKLFNLRTDPFERADITSNSYYDWFIDNDYIALAATAVMTQFLETFKEFPPRQRATLHHRPGRGQARTRSPRAGRGGARPDADAPARPGRHGLGPRRDLPDGLRPPLPGGGAVQGDGGGFWIDRRTVAT